MFPNAALLAPAALMTLLAWFTAVIHRAVISDLQHAGLQFPCPVRETDDVRDADQSGPARLWPHDPAHFFFSRARWNADDQGIASQGPAKTGLREQLGRARSRPSIYLPNRSPRKGHIPA